MYKPLILPHFIKQIKPFAKKHPAFKKDLIKILNNFAEKQHVRLGRNLFKIRMKSSDINRGKNKSFRLIVLVIELEGLLVPITIFAKNSRGNLSLKKIYMHMKAILIELKS